MTGTTSLLLRRRRSGGRGRGCDCGSRGGHGRAASKSAVVAVVRFAICCLLAVTIPGGGGSAGVASAFAAPVIPSGTGERRRTATGGKVSAPFSPSFLALGGRRVVPTTTTTSSSSAGRKDSTFAPTGRRPASALSAFRPLRRLLGNSAATMPSTDRPVSAWSGRLLFSPADRLPDGAVRIEVHNAPPEHSSLINTIARLKFDTDCEGPKEFVDFVTTDVNFSDEARASVAKGLVLPIRLDGLEGVSPLESLAGAREEDDMHVSLSGEVTVVQEKGGEGEGGDGEAVILIRESPVQIRGRNKCLVKFIEPVSEDEEEEEQPDADADPKNEVKKIKVVHYNPKTESFESGTEEIMSYIDFGPERGGDHPITRFTFTPVKDNAVNENGWYVYGARDDDDDTGMFTIEAIEPRKCLLLNPDEVYCGEDEGMEYVQKLNWKDEIKRKGTVGSVLVDPSSSPDAKADAISQWKIGDRLLVVHIFGGVYGTDANSIQFDERETFPLHQILQLVPGHFAYGDATIINCPFTNDPMFDIIHRQVYCHNFAGVISGPHAWHSFMGDLRARGLMGIRAVADVIVKFDPVARVYSVPGTESASESSTFDPLNELKRELNEMTSRYRTGDGDGSALIEPQSSCVQDSNQALYSALCESRKAVLEDNPALLEFVEANPDDGMAKDLDRLRELGKDLDDFLTPLGVRRDWTKTAKGLSGVDTGDANIITKVKDIVRAIKTFNTALPRNGHEGITKIFMKHGAKLWCVRTNQVGVGCDDDIKPLAPTFPFRGEDNDE